MFNNLSVHICHMQIKLRKNCALLNIVLKRISHITMSLLFGCGLCCFLLSIWAVLQLFVMGIFFKMEVLAFIEEAEPDHHGYEDFEDFMKQTKDNYQLIAVNCWVAAVIYLISMALSYMCMKHAKKKERLAAEKVQDDEAYCREKAKKT